MRALAESKQWREGGCGALLRAAVLYQAKAAACVG